MSKNPIEFIDLFCGAGGLSVGFEKSDFRSIFANDYDEFACDTYTLNHPQSHVYKGDVVDLSAKMIFEMTERSFIPLVIGGPNCQGVSLRGKRDPNDPKNKMFHHFKRLIEELQPEWFVMENVPGLLHRHNRELITDIFDEFHGIGYECGGEVLLAADYGVPQLRYRFFLIGNRVGQPILFPNATHQCPIQFDEPNSKLQPFLNGSNGNHIERPNWLTVFDAIGDLPPIPNGGGKEETDYQDLKGQILTPYQSMVREDSHKLYNHVCHRSSESNIEMISHIPSGKNWKSIPLDLRPERFQRVALKDHTTTYGRLTWDSPSRTITTYFNNISAGAFTHPEQHRGIGVREGARLQSFPDDFRFRGSLARQYRQVGNAVPPLLASNIAMILHKMMIGDLSKLSQAHEAAVVYNSRKRELEFRRPVQGMRFNLDKYLVRS